MESTFLGFTRGTGITLGIKYPQSVVYPRIERMFPRKEPIKIRGKIVKPADPIGSKGMFSDGELKIGIDHSSLENQTNRFVTELGLSKTEAENISKDVRDLAEVKINEQGKNWSKTVREAFANLMTAILIEEAKTISPIHGNQKSLTAIWTYSAVAFDRTIRYDYRQTRVSAKLVSHAQTLDIENVNRLRDDLYPDRI